MNESENYQCRRNKIMFIGGNNKFRQRFERQFSESMLASDFYIKPEELCAYNGVSYLWDYGIYSKKNNSLVMIVDLDGDLYYGNNSKYNRNYSAEEYDEKRYLSIPENTKYQIICEFQFIKSFESMIRNLMSNYDEFVDEQFRMCRSIQFPFPKYNYMGLMKSWTQLRHMRMDSKYLNVSTNNRIGDWIISHFHESIYHAKCKGFQHSPYEAWHIDELLLKIIKNRIIFQNYLNPNKILQGFNIAKVAKRVSVFSAGRAKLLIHKYLNDCNQIFDPFSGFSGRMLGAIGSGKEYVGRDISPIHVNESNRILQFLKEHNVVYDATISNTDVLNSSGEYECLFTCSPYSNKEQWLNVGIDLRTCDDWIDECLSRFKCKRYLFVVDDTVKYKSHVVDAIRNRGHMGKNNEYVILINK